MATGDSEAEYRKWCQHVASLRPIQCQFEADDKKLVVAVLKDDRARTLNNTVDDFLWINCKTKTTVSQIHKAYIDKTPDNRRTKILCYQREPCNKTAKLKDIAVPIAGVLILQAFDGLMLAMEHAQIAAQKASTNTPETGHGSSVRSPLSSTTTNSMPKDPDHNSKGQFVKQDDVLQENVSPSTQLVNAAAISHSNPSPLKDFPAAVKSDGRSTQPTTDKRPSLPSIDTIIKTLPPPESPANQQPPPWLRAPDKLDVGSPPIELPSKKIPDQNVNQPFLRYLDHYYQNSQSVRSLPLTTLVDHVWSLWQALPAKSTERRFFTAPVLSEINNAGFDYGKEEFDPIGRRLEDIKPQVPQEAGHSQQEEPTTLLDFTADFGEVEKPETQTSELSGSAPVTQPEASLRNIMDEASTEELEIFVTRGATWLDEIKKTLETYGATSKDAANWLKMVEQIKSYSARTKTVIGVVGNTGAGKSSVINALLDEEQLLPTNTMRACTAVVTEIAYNFEEGKVYRAEIEFIDEKSWQDELGIMFHDLLNSQGEIVRDSSTPDSDAGIAYAKIKAVYPKKTKDEIAQSSIPNLIKEVSHILGKTQKVQDDDCLLFYKRLQRYIDSQEKVTANASAAERKGPQEMEFWPLIKVVRIYCKSDALATGATIVDLPGVHDANAARAAVAEGYMKQCSGLWIVAPIIRAVDDKAAKNLLGQTFKRQLKMDGGFSQVSFICSKTDDISLMEATASLGLEDVNGPLWAEADRQHALQTELKSKIKEYSTGREALAETMEALETQVDTWEALEQRQEEDGGPVYAPVERKRKSSDRESSSQQERKRQRRSSDDDISDVRSGSEFEDTDDDAREDDAEVSIRKALTLEEIVDRIATLKGQMKNARKERADLNRKIKEFKDKVQESIKAQREVEASIAERCIAGRNEYSKKAIRRDFAAGVREIDQEKAQDEDEANFDPEEEGRDYDEVARSLPVFCISSRGYQQLSGRLKKDTKVPGFTELDQTEVPALKKHCKHLTVAGRTAACKKFLVAVSHLANSLSMWAASDGTNKHLTPQQKENEKRFLSMSLGNLGNALTRLITSTYEDLQTEMQINIFDKFDVACKAAEDKAIDTSSSWGYNYVWATYKAVCRRNGAYTNAKGPIDFNVSLAEPMMVHILSFWERFFSRKIASVLHNLKRNLKELLQTFHGDVSARAQLSGIGTATLPVLQQQLANYEHGFDELSVATKTSIDQAQRDINREFTPSIMRSMTPGYVECVEERGPGSYMRMKGHMNKHVSHMCRTMFRTSCAGVEADLKKVMRKIKEDLGHASDGVFDAIQRDYRSALSGGDLKHGEIMPRWQREMRKAVANLAQQLQDYIVLDTPPENPKTQISDDEAAALQLEASFGLNDDKVGRKGPVLAPHPSFALSMSRQNEDEYSDEDSESGEYDHHPHRWRPWHGSEEDEDEDEDEDQSEPDEEEEDGSESSQEEY